MITIILYLLCYILHVLMNSKNMFEAQSLYFIVNFFLMVIIIPVIFFSHCQCSVTQTLDRISGTRGKHDSIFARVFTGGKPSGVGKVERRKRREFPTRTLNGNSTSVGTRARGNGAGFRRNFPYRRRERVARGWCEKRGKSQHEN